MVVRILFMRLLLGTLSEVEVGDELEVGVGGVLQHLWMVKYQYLLRVMIGPYLLMQRLFMGMCKIVSRGMGKLRLHPVLLSPQCFKIP